MRWKKSILPALVAALACSTCTAPAWSGPTDGHATQTELSLAFGCHVFNETSPAIPEAMFDVPVTMALTYHLTRIWGIEGEFTWIQPIEQSIEIAGSGEVDKKSPNIMSYQVSALAMLPLSDSAWSPFLVAGAGAITFLSNDDADRQPILIDSQTMPAINLGVGTTYRVSPHWAVRVDVREYVAFPADDAEGFSDGSESDPIWMERGSVGAVYRF